MISYCDLDLPVRKNENVNVVSGCVESNAVFRTAVLFNKDGHDHVFYLSINSYCNKNIVKPDIFIRMTI